MSNMDEVDPDEEQTPSNDNDNNDLNESSQAQGSTVSSRPTSVFLSLIDFYGRNQFYGHIRRISEAHRRNSPNDPIISFWLGFAHTSEGQHGEAIKIFNSIINDPAIVNTPNDCRLAATAAIIQAHKAFKSKDKEIQNKLKENLKVLSNKSNNDGLIHAARYFWHAGKEKQARQCLEKVLNKGHKHVEALTLFAWINLLSGISRNEKKSSQFFDAAIKLSDAGTKDVSAFMGRALSHCMLKKRYDKAIEDLNNITASFEDFAPAQAEKCRILMIQQNWDEALVVANQLLRRDGADPDICALRISMVYFLTRESKSGKTVDRVSHFVTTLQQQEPYNAPLFYSSSQLISRLAQKNERILEQSLLLIRAARRLDPNNSYFMTEEASQLLLLNRTPQAASLFSEASTADGNNLLALHGSIKCKVAEGEYEYAKQELDFLSDVQATDSGGDKGTNIYGQNTIQAELTYLHAVLASKLSSKGKNNKNDTGAGSSSSLDYLNIAVSEHAKTVEQASSSGDGFNYYIVYNPDFVLDLVDLYMQNTPSAEPRKHGDPSNPQLDQAVALLRQVTELVPSLFGAQLLLAKTAFISGDFISAERALSAVLRVDSNSASAHMIQAQIYLAREQYKQASESLTSARAADLSVRDTAAYHLMKATLLEASDQTDDALKVLQAAMELPGVKKNSTQTSTGYVVSVQERISIYLELASVYSKLGQLPEATRVMNEARNDFKGSAEAARISMAESDLAVKRGDIDGALNLLKSVRSDSPYATRAKVLMADIYLVHKKNRNAYASAYADLAAQANDSHSYVLLGEAYMRIQEPERAIRAYQNALKLSPNDAQLASKIGRALVATHDYSKAKDYYITAVKQGSQGTEDAKIYLYHELASLHISLKEFNEAASVCEQALAETGASKQTRGDDDIHILLYDVKSQSLLATVHESTGNKEGQKLALTAAFELQGNVLSLLRVENVEQKREQKEIMSHICFRLAEIYKNEEERALQYYNEALKHNEQHEGARLALAKLHLLNNELDLCHQQCLTLLRMNPNNTEVAMMMADILFRQNEPDRSTAYFQDLLDKNTHNYEALARLIQLLKRAGKLNEAPRFLKQAEKGAGVANTNASNANNANPSGTDKAASNPVAGGPAGLEYCRGLHFWYTNNPREALSAFNHARKDNVWGKQATMNMIDIYLNPDNQALISQQAEAKGDNTEQINSAEKLLNDLKSMGEKSHKFEVLRAYALLARKDKNSVENALNIFMNIINADRDYVPAMLGSAFALLLKNEETKAKNQLKRISKMKLNPDFAGEFERSWLLLASTYEKIGKVEFAQELCKKCLAYNKSCAAAWEMLGSIMEKEQAYKDAADHYEHAWTHMNQSSGSIGFKLAFNYLKAKRYVEAIDVCHKVLKKFPDYPKIRKEILDKARQSLRP